MKILLVRGNKVVNIVKGNEEFLQKIKQEYTRAEFMPEYEVKIGATWNGQVYINPKNKSF